MSLLPADPLDTGRHPSNPSTSAEAGSCAPGDLSDPAVHDGPHDLLAPAEPVLPPDLLDPAGPYERWAALYTHPNCERRVAEICARIGVRHYLPLLEQWVGPEHSRHRAIAPLFSSYVFACADRESFVSALQVGRIARVVRVDREDVFLEELRQIRLAIAGDPELAAGPALEHGDRVRVIHGPLVGVEGLVEGLRRRRRHHRLVLNVSMLGRAVSTEVDVRDVERVRYVAELRTAETAAGVAVAARVAVAAAASAAAAAGAAAVAGTATAAGTATPIPYWRAPATARRAWT